jgi:hypothetical protein
MKNITDFVKLGVTAGALSLAFSVSPPPAKSAPIPTSEFAQSNPSTAVKPILLSQWFPWWGGGNNGRAGDGLCIQAGGNGNFIRSVPINGGYTCDYTNECFRIDYSGNRR